MNEQLVESALGKLRQYGPARDRWVDRELRQVTLTDDEAVAVIEYIEFLEATA